MATDTSDNTVPEGKFFAIISYIAFFCIVTLILKKDNKFALYHAKHGLVLFICEVVSFILTVIPLLGALINAVGFTLFACVSIWGIYQAFKGNYSTIPLVTKIAEKITL